MFHMKLSIYEFLYVVFSSSVRDCCFTSLAGTFHPLFLISEDFSTTEYFISHIKRGGLLKSICMFKVSNFFLLRGAQEGVPATSCKFSPSYQENSSGRLPQQSFGVFLLRSPPPLAGNSPHWTKFLCYNLIKTSFYSHYSCTIFTLTSYSLYRQFMIIVTLMFIIYRMSFFNFVQGSSGLNHSSDSHHLISHNRGRFPLLVIAI